MFTILAWIGRLAVPLVTSVVPGFSPAIVLWFAGAFAVLVAIGGPAGAVWLHMHGARGEAIKAENARCELRIAEGAAASAESLSHLLGTIKTGEETAVEPKTPAEEIKQCKASKLCRENGK